MAAAVGAIAVKLSINGLRGKEFKLHEQGRDVTLMTVGAAIPGAAIPGYLRIGLGLLLAVYSLRSAADFLGRIGRRNAD